MKKKIDVDVAKLAAQQRHLYLLQKLRSSQPLSAAETKELAKRENKTTESTKKQNSKGTIAADQIITTQKSAALYAGVAPRTIRRWVEAGMLKTEGGCYIKNQLESFKASDGRQTTETKVRKDEAEADLKSSRAELVQMELAIKKGEYVKLSDYEKRDIERILVVKRALLGLGRKIAGSVPPKHRRRVLIAVNKEARHLIKGFAGHDRDVTANTVD